MWIVSPWTIDGRHVSALGHNEYRGNTHAGKCRFDNYPRCWYNSIVSLTSKDGGRSFAANAGMPPIANAAFGFEKHQGAPRGFFDPTNIVPFGGDYYALIFTTGGDDQRAGTCLFRTSDPGVAQKWEYLTRSGFAKSSFDPYAKPASAPLPPCEPVAGLKGAYGRYRAIAGPAYLSRRLRPRRKATRPDRLD